jgi:hypothetical protein
VRSLLLTGLLLAALHIMADLGEPEVEAGEPGGEGVGAEADPATLWTTRRRRAYMLVDSQEFDATAADFGAGSAALTGCRRA